MTGALERELADVVAATLAADEADVPRLLEMVRLLRADDDLRYEDAAAYLEALAARKTERLRVCQRLADRGLLEDTQVLTVADLADDE